MTLSPQPRLLPVQRLQLCQESSVPYEPRSPVLDAEEAARLFCKYAGDYASEVLLVLLLDAKGKPISIVPAHIGTLDSTMVRPREIFVPALLSGAKSVIIGHNHPSGDVTPSESDVECTFSLVHAGEIVGVTLRDHVIFAMNGTWCSLKTKGYL